MTPAAELLVVANRLPVRRVRRAGEYSWETSPGGLVSALMPILRERGGTWIGWAGGSDFVPEPFEHDRIRNVPVPISKAELAGYYEGFSNGTLWPLYHDCVRAPEYHRKWWRPYVEVNLRFARAAAEAAVPESLVWVQDYHLQLVPRMLRELRPDLRIGFFLHIPFPPQELFAQLPWRRQTLEGLLGADVVGFQTRVGARNFGQLARRYAGAKGRSGRLEHHGRTIIHEHFPISIDFARFAEISAADSTRARARELREQLGGDRRIFLGVDRLDYTKGIDVRLKAFRELIESGLASTEDTVLVQTAVPSRERVSAYQRERLRIEQLVGEINGNFGTLGRVPVHYLHKSFPVEELVALYRAADVMLVTPLRDGMNLVCKEYVAARTEGDGVLILSEFTGATHELVQALRVNPHDVDGLATIMQKALEMPAGEARRRMRSMREVVRKHDVYAWARSFLNALQEA